MLLIILWKHFHLCFDKTIRHLASDLINFLNFGWHNMNLFRRWWWLGKVFNRQVANPALWIKRSETQLFCILLFKFPIRFLFSTFIFGNQIFFTKILIFYQSRLVLGRHDFRSEHVNSSFKKCILMLVINVNIRALWINLWERTIIRSSKLIVPNLNWNLSLVIKRSCLKKLPFVHFFYVNIPLVYNALSLT